MFVRLLQLREVDVLLDRLVLRAKLRQAARRMHLAIERDGALVPIDSARQTYLLATEA